MPIQFRIDLFMDEAPTRYEALIRCRDLAGSDSQMARDLNVSQPKVWRWINQSKQIQAEYVLSAERKYGVSRHILRPDIYPVEHKPVRHSWTSFDKEKFDHIHSLELNDGIVSFDTPTVLKGISL